MSSKTMARFATVGILFALGCGGAAVEEAGQDDLGVSSASFLLVEHDDRACPSPACGGYWVAPIGNPAARRYVRGFDLSKSGLGAADAAIITGAPAEELLLKGYPGAPDAKGTRALVVVEAYRGMPGIVPGANEALYSVAGAVQCVKAPCNDALVKPLAGGQASTVAAVNVARAAKSFVDQGWLASRVRSGRAVVAARMTGAASGGTVLDSSQVYVRVPEASGPCPKPISLSCGSGQVATYSRTAERCLVPSVCVTLRTCPMMQPACADGYVAASWRTAPDGCAATVCDPAWLAPAR